MNAELLELPVQITEVFELLDTAGVPAWLVGGCLRDLLLGRIPHDWDFATPSAPEDVKERLSARGVTMWDTGIRHGTITFRYKKRSYEITTFRIDGPYADFRRPKWVKYTDSLKEDLARRDFTINAMAYHWREGLSDPFDGARDMKNRVIRAVGVPEDRLGEDALRVMRGIRFAGGLDFELEDSLSEAMEKRADLLLKISVERIASELNAILTLPGPGKALRLMARLGVWRHIAPELAKTQGFDQLSSHHNSCVYEHTVRTAENLPPVLPLRLAALLHDIAKPVVFSVDAKGKGHFYHHETVGAEMAGAFMNRLRYSHDLRDQVVTLIRHHMQHIKDLSDEDLRRIVSGLPKPRDKNMEMILSLQKADLLASIYDQDSLVDFELFAARFKAVLSSGCPLDVSDLALSGGELEGLGLRPRDRGIAQRAMMDEVLRCPANNTREYLLWIAHFFANHAL